MLNFLLPENFIAINMLLSSYGFYIGNQIMFCLNHNSFVRNQTICTQWIVIVCNISHMWLLAWPIVPSRCDKILDPVNCDKDKGLFSFIKKFWSDTCNWVRLIVRLRKISWLNLSWFVRKVLLVHIIVSQYQHCYWHSAVYDEARFLSYNLIHK